MDLTVLMNDALLSPEAWLRGFPQAGFGCIAKLAYIATQKNCFGLRKKTPILW
jgi:hypothetical protein